MSFRFVLKPVPDIEHHRHGRRHKKRLDAVQPQKARWELLRGCIKSGRPENEEADAPVEPGVSYQPYLLAQNILNIRGTEIAEALNGPQRLDFDYCPEDGDLISLSSTARSPLQLIYWDGQWQLLGLFGHRCYVAAGAYVLHAGDFIVD